MQVRNFLMIQMQELISAHHVVETHIHTYMLNEGSGKCMDCEFVVNANRTACARCKPSFFQRRFLQNTLDLFSSVSDVCVKCPPKTYSPVNPDPYSFDRFACAECASGFQVNAAQTGCEPAPIIITDPPVCDAGQEYDVTTKKCVKCKVGYSKRYSFDSCTPCLPGYYAPNTGQENCYDCHYGALVNPDRSECTSYPASFYAEVSPVGAYPYTNYKSPVCVKCPQGTYTPYNGLTACRTCPAGIQVNDEQTGCGKPTQNPTRRPTIRSCVPGEEIYGDGCRECTPGNAPYYTHECWPCRAKTYAPNYKSASCMTCPTNKVVFNGKTSCVYCEPSYYRYQGPTYPYPYEVRAICKKCPAGQYSEFEDTGCHVCAAGSIVNALQTGCVSVV
jgi:hypothetical protein